MSLRADRIRILLATVLFAGVIFAPWWVPLIAGAALAVRFRAWEAVAAGILYDLLWMPAPVSFTSLESLPLATLIALAAVFALEPLRRQLLIGDPVL